MILVLLIYALASCLLLLAAGILVMKSIQASSRMGSSNPLSPPLSPAAGGATTSSDPASDFAGESRTEVIARLERQFHNSPSKPDL